MLIFLAMCVSDRDDLETALGHAQQAVHTARELRATGVEVTAYLITAITTEANILEWLGRLDEAIARDTELLKLSPGKTYPEPLERRAIKHIALGEDAEAERVLRFLVTHARQEWHQRYGRRTIEGDLRRHTLLAELLERRGTEEALAEARMLRDGAAQQLAAHEARRAAALEETRAASAEAVRQWREERSKARDENKESKGKGKKKGKKKGRKGRAKGKGASSASAIEGEQPREPAGNEAEGAATAEAKQQAQVGESQPPGEREECAICLQDLQLEDDEDPWCDEGGEGEALVVLRCGHRFHEICGDMWCAKCADKGWGVTCPRCRAPYVVAKG
jgi:hypothetical protein